MATVYLIRPIEIVIFVYTNLSLFTIGYNLRTRPMNTRTIQIIDNTNEFFILLSGYAIIIFSPWMYDPTNLGPGEQAPEAPLLRYSNGFIYRFFLGLIMFINVSLILFEI